jgi:hypothetical protein
MALMKLTAFNGGIRGKVQGTVFQYCPYGQVVKGGLLDAISAGAKLTKADAGRVMPVKAYLTELSSAWRSLTDVQRTTWTTQAPNYPFTNKWGDTYTPSGFLLYMKMNLNLMKVGLPEVHTAPAPEPVINGSPFTVVYSADAGTFNLTGFTITSGYTQYIQATTTISKGKKPVLSSWKSIYVLQPGDTDPFNLTSYYNDVFGQIPVHGNVWFRIWSVNNITGMPGAPYLFQLVW